MKCGDIELVKDEFFGLIIANINKNILKGHLSSYSAHLEPGGVLLLSGFFITDVDEMVSCAEENGLMLIKRFEKDEWAAIQLLKKIKK